MGSFESEEEEYEEVSSDDDGYGEDESSETPLDNELHEERLMTEISDSKAVKRFRDDMSIFLSVIQIHGHRHKRERGPDSVIGDDIIDEDRIPTADGIVNDFKIATRIHVGA